MILARSLLALIRMFCMRCQCADIRLPGVRTYQSAGVPIHIIAYSPPMMAPKYSVPTDVINSLCVMRSHVYPLFRRSWQASRTSSMTKTRLSLRRVAPRLCGPSASMQGGMGHSPPCHPQLDELEGPWAALPLPPEPQAMGTTGSRMEFSI